MANISAQKSRSDETLLTGGFNLRTAEQRIQRQVLQGRYFLAYIVPPMRDCSVSNKIWAENLLSALLILLLLLFSTTAAAQRIENVCGEYAFPASDDVTPRQARQAALELAKIEAIASMFKTIVSDYSLLDKREENGIVSGSFISITGNEVKGEWIKDSVIVNHDPYFDEELKLWFYKVSVCGTAREIISAGVDFSVKLLRNGTEKRDETVDYIFRDDDNIFLAFRTPQAGFLAVYLVDDSETAFCMLPYIKDQNGSVPVQANKDYIFFSKKHAEPAEKQMVTEYFLSCDKQMETNRLYVIFSPNRFTKANDSSNNDTTIPNELPFDDFLRWLERNKIRDKDLKDDVKPLTIRK